MLSGQSLWGTRRIEEVIPLDFPIKMNARELMRVTFFLYKCSRYWASKGKIDYHLTVWTFNKLTRLEHDL